MPMAQHGRPNTFPAVVLKGLKEMSRADRYQLACRIVSEISDEWSDAEDPAMWQEENVVDYDSSMSFDELAAEIRAVVFK